MSQMEVEKSEDASQTAAQTTDVAGQPSSGPKKSPMIAIIAIIVVVALIATAFAVMIMGGRPEAPVLEIKIVPSSVQLANGSTVKLMAYATLKNSSTDVGWNLSDDVGLTITCTWQAGNASLGTLTRGLDTSGLTYFTLKTNKMGSSSLNWSFQFTDPDSLVEHKATKKTAVQVGIAVLSYIEINPAEKVLLKGKSQTFSAKAFLTNGVEVNSSLAGLTWSRSPDAIGNISGTTGESVVFVAGLVNATGNLTCSGTYAGKTVFSNAKITVITVPPPQSIKTRIYDMFDVPFGSYWLDSNGNGKDDRYQEYIIHNAFPYTYSWLGNPVGNNWIYAPFRMNVTAKNISKCNTTDAPWYLPVLNPTVRGGNIKLDWIGNYIDWPTMIAAGYETGILTYYDSWIWRLNGTITMDRTAAKMVMNMTDVDFDNFDTWKANEFTNFQKKYSAWIVEQINEIWAIKFCYEYEGNLLSETYDVVKIGESVVLQIKDRVSWGEESLMGRWWRETFLQWEGWPEDVHFTANIGPMVSDFNLDAAIQYQLHAEKSARDGRTSWVFENTHADALQGTYGPYESELNPYIGKKYWNQLPANAGYQTWTDYDYTPWAWNLTYYNESVHDETVIEWPDVSTIIGYEHNGTGNYNETVVGKIDPLWIEPVLGELPSNVMIDYSNKTITLKGPMDAWTWSKTSLAARELRENWSRVGVLPRGCPYIVFVVNNDVNLKPVAALSIPNIWGTNSSHTLRSASYDVDGSIASYKWDYGDGSPIDTTAIPTTAHIWTTEANCTVVLNVTDNLGAWATDTVVVQILDNLPPVAALTGSIYGNIQSPMTIVGNTSYDMDTMDNSTIVSYEWDFGDGNTDITTTSVTTHSYAAIGTYNVTLTVVDDKGGTGTTMRMYVISTDLCAKIVIPKSACITENVGISGSLSFTFSAPTKTIVNWSWEFGDGTVGWGQSVTHAWSSVGMMQVNLTVTDNTGWVSPVSSSKIAIAPAPGTVTGLAVTLARHSLLPSESTTLTVKAVNGAGKVVTGFTGTVDVTVNGSGAWTDIPYSLVFAGADNGVKTLSVSCSTPGQYNITATSTTLNGSAFATVNDRTVEIKIYNIFEGTMPDYWYKRMVYYMGADEGFRNSTPVVGIYRPTSVLTAAQINTMYMLSVEARNVPEYNMSNPTFAGLMNPTTGKGNATFTMDSHFMTKSEVENYSGVYFSVANGAGWDGWEYFITANLTMDREAAEQMINLPQSEADPLAWWAINNLTVKNFWRTTYLGGEGSTNTVEGRLSVRASEDGYSYQAGIWGGTNLYNNYRLVLVDGGKVALNYKHFGYGEDVLITRFLYWGGPALPAAAGMPSYPNGTTYGILPFEPWFENMSLTVDIHEKTSNVSFVGGVEYGWRAWKSDVAPEGTAAWRLEAIRTDYLSPGTYASEMDIWALDAFLNPTGRTYLSLDPGSSKYGEQILYDYAPAVTMLKPGESFWMEAPRVLGIGYLPGRMVGDPSDTSGYLGGYYAYLRVLEKWGNATIHPIGCTLGTAVLDKQYGDLTIVGPFTPIIQYIAATPWLWYEPAPRIELWIQ